MSTKKTIIEGLKIIRRELWNYKKELIILILLGIVSALISALNPYLWGKIFDAITGPRKTFFIVLAVWLSLKLVGDAVDWQSGLKREYLSADISADYIVKSLSKILEMPLSFHKERKIGSVTHRIARAASGLDPIIGRVLINLLPQFLSIVIALAIAFYFNYRLACLLLLAILLYVVVLIKKAPPLVDLAGKMHRAYHQAYGDASDSVLNIQSVKQATAEKEEKRKFHKGFSVAATGFRKKLVKIWVGLDFYQQVIIIFAQSAIFLSSLVFIREGQMTIGELIMFNSYGLMIFGPFFTLGNYWQLIQNGMMALIQSEKLLKLPTENYSPNNPTCLTDIRGQIQFRNVDFYYKRGQKILENISLEIRPGETIALVGESGVGKTTLVDLISGFYFPKAGRVEIDGRNIKRLDLKSLRKKISVVPQDIVLFNDTVRNNIRYGSFKSADEEIEEAAKLAHADEFINNFPKKYNQLVGERGIKLSAGQKQRIAISRAVLQKPKILILDEPTSSLDARSEELIQKSLEKLMLGRTTIIIAHRLSTVRKADKIIVLEKGRIVEQGKHEELVKIKDGVYRRLYELQIGLV